MKRRRARPGFRPIATATVAAMLLLAFPQVAAAFDTSPHFDITGDALAAEGFGGDAQRVAQVNNWFNDLYVNAESVPQSGHAAWWRVLLGARWFLGEVESWPDKVVKAGSDMHFDSTNGGMGYRREQDLENEWNRLLDMTVRVCISGRPQRSAALPHGDRSEPARGAGLLRAHELGRAGVRPAPRVRRPWLARAAPAARRRHGSTSRRPSATRRSRGRTRTADRRTRSTRATSCSTADTAAGARTTTSISPRR